MTNVRLLYSPLAQSGKTTLAMTLAWLFRKYNRRVLFCDLDMKGMATLVFKDASERYRPRQIGDLAKSTHDCARDIMTPIERSDFDVLTLGAPFATADIDGALATLDKFTARLEPGRFYDEVVIDLSSGFEVQHLISFLSANTIIVPVALNARAIESVSATLAMTGELIGEVAMPAQVVAIPAMVREQSSTQRAIGESLTNSFGKLVTPAFYERAVFKSCIVDGGPFWDAKGIRDRKRRLEEVEAVFASVLSSASSWSEPPARVDR